MSERRAFDYVVVQVVPRVDRDERMNAGVILFCPASGFLGCRVALDRARLRALAPDVDIDVDGVARQLAAVEAVAEGAAGAGPIAALSRSERFHWLSAPRSTMVQPSVPHAGLCDDPAAALDRLFRAVVPAPAGPLFTAAGRPSSR